MDRNALHQRSQAARLIDAHVHLGLDPAGYLDGNYPYALSGEDLVMRLDRMGLDMAVAFPFVYSGYFDLAAWRMGRFRRARGGCQTAPYAGENRALCHELYQLRPEFGERVIPFAFFDPGRLAQEQAAVLRDLAAEFPLCGLKTASTYLHSRGTALLKTGRPLLDLAAEMDWPVLLHTSIHPDDAWANVFDLLTVVRARPDVRFCLAHSCRFSRRALEAAALLDNCWVDCSALCIHCRLATQGSPIVAPEADRFAAPYHDPAATLAALAAVLPGKLLWGTDAPYYQFHGAFTDASGVRQMFHLPCTMEEEAAVLQALDGTTRARIAHENTLRFLWG